MEWDTVSYHDGEVRLSWRERIGVLISGRAYLACKVVMEQHPGQQIGAIGVTVLPPARPGRDTVITLALVAIFLAVMVSMLAFRCQCINEVRGTDMSLWESLFAHWS